MKHWTPHDFDAHSDPKILKLLSKYSWEGYGWYWRIIEMMGMETNHALSHLDDIDTISFELRVTPEKVQEFLEFCIKYELFRTDKTVFWSARLTTEMEKYDSIVKKKSKAGKASAEARAKRMSDKRLTGVEHVSNGRSTNTIEYNTTEHSTVENNTKNNNTEDEDIVF